MYDIKFYSGNAEYDYEIDAHTGNIIKLNYDIEGYEISNVPAYNDGLYIGSDTARSIALSQVGLTLALSLIHIYLITMFEGCFFIMPK